MSRDPASATETIETHGCRIVLRRVDGPEARELFLLCQPTVAATETTDAAEPRRQAEAIYAAIVDVLENEGGSFSSVVSETLYLRKWESDLGPVRSGRRRVLVAHGADDHRPATLEIQEPPLEAAAHLEVSVQAAISKARPLRLEHFATRSACDCGECANSGGVGLRLGDESRFHALGLYGRGADAYEQTLAMFGVAEDLLRQAGMEFGDVVRCWIHLREMERDYGALNRARRAFFEERGIDPVPASTGIGGSPVAGAHDLCLGVYAVKSDYTPDHTSDDTSGHTPDRAVMTSPTLNEAGSYGADFVRGMRSVESNKVALHVSGTASIDEAGRTAHPGDLDAQIERMLVNVAALLEGQGADFGDIVSGVTYLKRSVDAPRLREKLRDAGFEGFPNVLVEAEVCRPELLCETEVLAVLPRSRPASDPS